MGLFRRGGLPGDVREALGLARGERVLSYGQTPLGSYVVATDRALYFEEAGGYRALGWEAVEKAGWDDERSSLDLVQTGHGPGRRHSLMLAEPGYLPETVRERVMSSIVVSQYVRLTGTRGVRIVGRRDAGGGELHWTFAFDPGLDPDDPGVRAAADQALAELRLQTGV